MVYVWGRQVCVSAPKLAEKQEQKRRVRNIYFSFLASIKVVREPRLAIVGELESAKIADFVTFALYSRKSLYFLGKYKNLRLFTNIS